MTLVPSFGRMINYFTIPQHLLPEEQKQFASIALEVETRITEESEHKDCIQLTWNKDVLGKRVIDAIVGLCERAGYIAVAGTNLEEWVLDVRFT